MLKLYLELRDRSVRVEIDTYEVCHHIDILDGHHINTVMDIYASYEALRLFEQKFPSAQQRSSNLKKYIDLRVQTDVEAAKHKKRLVEEIKRKFSEIRAMGNETNLEKAFIFIFVNGRPPAWWGP